MENVSVLAAFLAGVISFLSPCVLPIVPAYLSYLSGNSSVKADKNFDVDILLASIFFVLGFTVVFSIMGLSASFIGGLFRDYSSYVSKIGGAFVVFFGLHFSGILIKKDFLKYLGAFEGFLFSFYAFHIINLKTFEELSAVVSIIFALYMLNLHNILYQQFKLTDDSKINMNTRKGFLKYVFAFTVGLSFAFGWTPCIGPVLGSILFYASQESTLYKGAYLLFIYSMGLGVPFIVSGALFGAFIGFLKRFKRAFELVEIAGGILLVLMGIFLVLGKITIISSLI